MYLELDALFSAIGADLLISECHCFVDMKLGTVTSPVLVGDCFVKGLFMGSESSPSGRDTYGQRFKRNLAVRLAVSTLSGLVAIPLLEKQLLCLGRREIAHNDTRVEMILLQQ